MKDLIYKTTDDVAFQLGKLEFPKMFYGSVIWNMNKEPFELFHFFDWTVSSALPCKAEEGYPIDWENLYVMGRVRLDKIKEPSHRLNYVLGRLQSYSVRFDKDTLTVSYANSQDLRDFFAECLNLVIMDKFILAPSEEGSSGRMVKRDAPKFQIEKGELLGTIPCCSWVKLTADEQIINFFFRETSDRKEENSRLTN